MRKKINHNSKKLLAAVCGNVMKIYQLLVDSARDQMIKDKEL